MNTRSIIVGIVSLGIAILAAGCEPPTENGTEMRLTQAQFGASARTDHSWIDYEPVVGADGSVIGFVVIETGEGTARRETTTIWSDGFEVTPDPTPDSFVWTGDETDPEWTVQTTGTGGFTTQEAHDGNTLLRLGSMTQPQQNAFVSLTSPTISTHGAEGVELSFSHKLTCITDGGSCTMRVSVYSSADGQWTTAYEYTRTSGAQELAWDTETIELPTATDDDIAVAITLEAVGKATANWLIDDVSVTTW